MRKSQGGMSLASDRHRLGLDASETYSTSSSSLNSSFSDGSDLVNWEEYVAEDGSLFYAEYVPSVKTNATDRRGELLRRSLRLGKKTTRRQQQNRGQQGKQQQHNGNNNSGPQPEPADSSNCNSNNALFRFADIKNSHDNPKQLELVITATDRFRFGRRSTAVESILGFRVLPFPDQPECLMVDSFVHDISAMQHSIKRGDWFKSLNGIELYASNVDELLQQFLEPTQVCLAFQGTSTVSPADAAEESLGMPQVQQVRKLLNFAMFAEQFEQLLPASAAVPDSLTPFGMLLLPPECYQQDQHKDSLYYYPESAVTNFLYKARGSFLTLSSVLNELQTEPLTSRLLVEQVSYYVNYRRLNGFLVLFAYAAELYSAAESSLRSDELIGYIRFSLPGLNLDNFATADDGSSGLRLFLRHFCGIQRCRLLAQPRGELQFEQLLQESRNLPLPKEAQLRIFDALSEMEAMDYRNWNDEPLTTHREFFIYGCALYYDHFLLASLLPAEVRSNVELFLRCRGIFDFIGAAPGVRVRELYVWEEIVLANATGRYFLTVCSRSHLILTVILKMYVDEPEMEAYGSVPPSLFYIEEIQETLDHLIQCGIESLAKFWSVSNKRPEVLDQLKIEQAGEEQEANGKLESFLKPKLTVAHSASGNDDEAQLCSSLGGSSIHSLTPSEDDISRRRLTPADDSDSGSDWENFAEQHPLHYGLNLNAETQSQITTSLWKEINNVLPVKISAGWKNSVWHYVYVDMANGVVLCPFTATPESFPYLSEMRRACHTIHLVLERSKLHRRQLTESTGARSTTGHDITMIKEHGITLEVANAGKDQAGVRFVVVGRLFQSPAKEVYVCHRPEVPQNMVELAFRLSFFSMG
ncbi:LOW QUALITY PROTEIN: protein inturned [Drosophila nasuta]|uniref:LOW QUALITY PROTEIN: protein inturned n=1 Tax=Drosophila nasuta TaxID=42062 RepID=UPI00295F1992|nr:LOW QUALITY PROTEIN: protein inturned [Drosophila nasuta]